MSWVKIDDGFADHPKMLKVGPLAMLLQVKALCYCARYLTNGQVPYRAVEGMISWTMDDVATGNGTGPESPSNSYSKPDNYDLAKALVEAGAWHQPDGEFGDYEVHDYLKYQPSRADEEARRARLSDTRSRAGRVGGRNKSLNRASKPGSKAAASVQQVGSKGAAKVHQNCSPVPVPVPVPVPREKEISPAAPPAVATHRIRAPKPGAPKAEKPPTHPRFSDVMAAYSESFEGARGERPLIGSRDGGAVNALLERCRGDADRAIAVVRAAFADPFKAKNATIVDIAANPAKYQGATSGDRVNGQPVQPPSPYSRSIVIGRDVDPEKGRGQVSIGDDFA